MMDKKRGLIKDLYIISYLLRITNDLTKSYLPLLVLSIVVKSLQPLSFIIIPRYIIDELTGERNIRLLTMLIALFAGSVFILNILNNALNSWLNAKNEYVLSTLDLKLGQKAMEMDYEYLENPQIQDLKSKAVDGMHRVRGVRGLGDELINIVSGMITLAALAFILGKLQFLIVLFLFIIVALNTYFNNLVAKVVYRFWDELAGINRKFRYMSALMMDFKYGKDIRLYDMKEIMNEKNCKYQEDTFSMFKQQVKQEHVYSRYRAFATQLQRIVMYIYLTFKLFINSITFGEFTMYAAAANSLVDTFTGMAESIITLRWFCQYSEAYVEFNSLEPVKMQGNRLIERNKTHEVEFKNVSFKYPGSERYVLKNVSIKLIPNERLSIVGMNGAGKTTFIKLLIRLYDPVEGEILLDGVNIKEYSYKEYLSLFSVVFQDFGLVAASIAENIAPGDTEKRVVEKIYDAVERAGLKEKVSSLDNSLDTQIYKVFDEYGVEFSGGETQKLAIARAIYKESPFIVLDEPTAALDPIAEYEIYHHFNQLIGNKTAVYISHRLSSCRFCDSIAVFDNGEIVEQGKHDELIQIRGKYHEMFSTQAQYYV